MMFRNEEQLSADLEQKSVFDDDDNNKLKMNQDIVATNDLTLEFAVSQTNEVKSDGDQTQIINLNDIKTNEKDVVVTKDDVVNALSSLEESDVDLLKHNLSQSLTNLSTMTVKGSSTAASMTSLSTTASNAIITAISTTNEEKSASSTSINKLNKTDSEKSEALRRHSVNNIPDLFNNESNSKNNNNNNNTNEAAELLLCYLCIKVNTHKGINIHVYLFKYESLNYHDS